jgi:hypothetical protein
MGVADYQGRTGSLVSWNSPSGGKSLRHKPLATVKLTGDIVVGCISWEV